MGRFTIIDHLQVRFLSSLFSLIKLTPSEQYVALYQHTGLEAAEFAWLEKTKMMEKVSCYAVR